VETPKVPTPEEMAKIQKSRAISDAELLSKGAEYKADKEGGLRLEATEDQISAAKKEMESDLASEDWRKEEEVFISSLTGQEKEFYSHGQSTMESYKKLEPILAKLSDEEKKVVMTEWSKPFQERRNHFFSTMPDADRRREIDRKAIEFFNKKHTPDIKEQLTPNNENNEIKIESGGSKNTREVNLREIEEQKYQKFNTLNEEIYKDEGTANLYSLLVQKIHKGRPAMRDGKYNYHLLEDFLGKVPTLDNFEQLIGEGGVDDGMDGSAIEKFKSVVYKNEYSKKIFEKAMPGVKNFDELFAVVNSAGGIQGSQEFFDAKQLLDVIQKVRNGEIKSTAITRTVGLRQKVVDLMAIEKHRNTIRSQ